MLEGGQAGVGEQNLLSDLAFQALQGDQANRQAATGQMGALDAEQRARAGMRGDLATAGAQLGAMAPQLRGQFATDIPQLAQMLTAATGMPMDALNSLLSFFTAANDPTYSLLRMVLPEVGQRSRSFGMSGNASVGGS